MRRSFLASILAAAVVLTTIATVGCKTDTSSRTEDSLNVTTIPDTSQVRNPVTTPPSVTTLPDTSRVDSVASAPSDLANQTISGASAYVDDVPPAPIQFKYIAKSETAQPRLEFFVIAIDRLDSSLTLHCLLMNRVGKVSQPEQEKIDVKLTNQQLKNASVLEDHSGDRKRLIAKLNTNVLNGKITLNPGDTKTLNISFQPVSAATKTATLIIPDFVTVSGILLPNP